MTEDVGVLGAHAGSALAARGYESAMYMGATMIRYHRGLEPMVLQDANGNGNEDPGEGWLGNPNAWSTYVQRVNDWLIDVEYRGLTPYLTVTYQPGTWKMPVTSADRTAVVDNFRTFCSNVAQQFNGRILHFGVWNEPNNHIGGRGAGSQGGTGLDTSPDLYNAMYRHCYAAIKTVNPSTTVYYGEIDAHKRASCRYITNSLLYPTLTDGIAIHTYQWNIPPEQYMVNTTAQHETDPTGIACQGIGRLTDWNNHRAFWSNNGLLRTPNGGTPTIHITEHGHCVAWGECPDTPAGALNRVDNENLRADYARRSFLWASQHGVATFSYYHLFNRLDNPDKPVWDSGIVAPDGAWTQSVYALRDAVVWAGSQPDFSGDGKPDVLARRPDGTLLMHRGNRLGSWLTQSGEQVGAGWGLFNTVISPGDFSGDARPDLLARKPDGTLWMYKGSGTGTWTGVGQSIGATWDQFDALVASGDFDGDRLPDVLARKPNGTLWMYRGNGAGSWIGFTGQQVGTGWDQFNAIIGAGDFDGDDNADVLARKPDGTLWLYRGNGAGSWIGLGGQQVGAGWDQFNAITAPGDFSGDGKPDLLARRPDGTLWMYRGNGAGSWIGLGGQQVGAGWDQFDLLLAVGR